MIVFERQTKGRKIRVPVELIFSSLYLGIAATLERKESYPVEEMLLLWGGQNDEAPAI